MASIIQDMGTQDIPRIRIGVGRPPAGVDPIAFLISEALGDEQRTLEEAAASAADSVEWVLAEGLEVAMTRTN